jgi:hypothetical protein
MISRDDNIAESEAWTTSSHSHGHAITESDKRLAHEGIFSQPHIILRPISQH